MDDKNQYDLRNKVVDLSWSVGDRVLVGIGALIYGVTASLAIAHLIQRFA